MHISYRCQAEKLTTEADELEMRGAWQCIEDEVVVQLQKPLEKETDRTEAGADPRDTGEILWEMRAVCLTSVRVLETGSLHQIEQLEKEDGADDRIAQGLHDTDEVVKDRLMASWCI